MGIFGGTPTAKVEYTGKEFPDLDIKRGMSLTEVNDILLTHYIKSMKDQAEFNSRVKSSFSDSDINISKNIKRNIRGKFSGTFDVSVQTNNFNSVFNFDLAEFKDSISDSILEIRTEIFGVPTDSRTLILSTDKVTFGTAIDASRFPIYGTSTVRVWEGEGDVTYVADFEIGSSNVTSYAFDYEVKNSLRAVKTQEEMNQSLLLQIDQLRNAIGNGEVEIDGVKYSSWKQCCSALSAQCNSLKSEIDKISGGSISKSVANCGEAITANGCVNC